MLKNFSIVATACPLSVFSYAPHRPWVNTSTPSVKAAIKRKWQGCTHSKNRQRHKDAHRNVHNQAPNFASRILQHLETAENSKDDMTSHKNYTICVEIGSY